ncbi:MAG: hypothetical protein ACP5J8_00585, partial [Minisyncoccia bacterium]
GLIYYVLYRYIIILFSVVTSPLAMLAWGIDVEQFKSLFTAWRSKFTQALVNIVILSIAFYFSLTIISGISDVLNELSNTSINGGKVSFVELIAYSFFVIVIIQFVRIIAKSIGVEQVEQGFQFAKKLTTDAIAAAGGAVVGFGAAKFMGSSAWQNVQTNLLKKGAEGNGINNILLGNMGKWMSKTSSTYLTQRYKAYEEALKGLPEEELRLSLNTALMMNDYNKAARVYAQLAEKNKLKLDLDLNNLAKLSQYPTLKPIIKKSLENNYPELAEAISKPDFVQDPIRVYKDQIQSALNNLAFVSKDKANNLANWVNDIKYLGKDEFAKYVKNTIIGVKNDEQQVLRILNNLTNILTSNFKGEELKEITRPIKKELENLLPDTIKANSLFFKLFKSI